jgi:Predicted transcriptional regulators
MRAHILAEQFTTGDVARALEVSREGVRYLEREEQLPCVRTRAGWRLFHKRDVLRLVERRTEARLRGVRRFRPKKYGPRDGPQQLSLFRPQRVENLGKGQVGGAGLARK